MPPREPIPVDDPRVEEILRRQAEKRREREAAEKRRHATKADGPAGDGPRPSPHKGVYWHRQSGRWVVQARGKHHGYFADVDQAIAKAKEVLAGAPAPAPAPAPATLPAGTGREPRIGERWLHRDGEPTLDCTVEITGVRPDGAFQTVVVDGNYKGCTWGVEPQHLRPVDQSPDARETVSGPEPEPEPEPEPLPEPEPVPVQAEIAPPPPPAVRHDPREPEVVLPDPPRSEARKLPAGYWNVPGADPEVCAIAAVVAALGPLDDLARGRILDYVAVRFATEATR